MAPVTFTETQEKYGVKIVQALKWPSRGGFKPTSLWLADGPQSDYSQFPKLVYNGINVVSVLYKLTRNFNKIPDYLAFNFI